MKHKTLIKRALGFSLISMLAHTSQVVAAPLDLEFEAGHADISVTGITFTYNATSDLLTAVGTASQYDTDTTNTNDFVPITDGSFSLSASIDDSGTLLSGSFEIGGNIGNGVNPLLTGDLTDFGFATGGSEVLEFVFDVTGGSEDSVFGSSGGLIIGQSGLPNDPNPFSGDWDNELFPGFGGFGTADAKSSVVPEPAEYSLIFGILSFLTFFVTRKINRK